ncbi:hypothetical protein WMY93_006808 [Mugilogobius chulae]|uniref:Tubulin-specific chaperone E n=1 Tax=Mugilogobius chulae TaxID=88201 RepID=A0AAW0PL29_9GOBI
MAADSPDPSVPEDAVGRRVSCGGERATVRVNDFVHLIHCERKASGLREQSSDPYLERRPERAHAAGQLVHNQPAFQASLKQLHGAEVSYGSVDDRAFTRRASTHTTHSWGSALTVRLVRRLWLGVEWDNPERGKHDGVHEGVHYFSCSFPGSGSFVRPAKVSFGVDFLSAVAQVYHMETDEDQSEDISIFSKTRSRSLIGRWEDVAAIAEQTEELETLQLSFNRLQLTSDPGSLSRAFLRLRMLTLNECALSWTQVLQCAPMWPQLQELGLEGNKICTISNPGPDLFQTLKSLSLSGNPLDQDSVLALSSLPRLEELNLSETGLSALRFSDAAPGNKESPRNVCSANHRAEKHFKPELDQSQSRETSRERLKTRARPITEQKKALNQSSTNHRAEKHFKPELSQSQSRETLNQSSANHRAEKGFKPELGEETKMFPVLKNLNLDHNDVSEVSASPWKRRGVGAELGETRD